ncbi:MAG: hypothetical protein H0T73_01330 [Ardenticatenales bacterium]|nr:hypothetical protein [Ardenticatenales bacterium]
MIQRFFQRFRRRGSSQSEPGKIRTAFLYTHIPATVIATSVGLLVLMDVLTNIPIFNGIGSLLVEYGLIVSAFALLLGVLNVLLVHIRKVREQEEGWPYSVVLIGTTIALIIIGVPSGPEGISWAATRILFPLQSAFFSLLAFFLLTVAYRAMRVNSVESLLLVGSATLVILGATPVGALISPLLVDIRAMLLAVPATAGTRGLLLGIALGTIVTGVRLVFDGRRYFK